MGPLQVCFSILLKRGGCCGDLWAQGTPLHFLAWEKMVDFIFRQQHLTILRKFFIKSSLFLNDGFPYTRWPFSFSFFSLFIQMRLCSNTLCFFWYIFWGFVCLKTEAHRCLYSHSVAYIATPWPCLAQFGRYVTLNTIVMICDKMIWEND